MNTTHFIITAEDFAQLEDALAARGVESCLPSATAVDLSEKTTDEHFQMNWDLDSDKTGGKYAIINSDCDTFKDGYKQFRDDLVKLIS